MSASLNSGNCIVISFQHRVIYVVNVLNMTVGFQVMVQQGAQERLYVNQTLAYHASARVEVDDYGKYLVSVFPIIEGKGIMGSNETCRKVVEIQGIIEYN